MERIWEDENNVHKGVYIARVTHQYDYYFVAGNEKDSLVVRKEHALGIADALQKSEGVDLRSDIARLEAENEEMQEAIKVYEKSDIFFRAEVARLTAERDRMRETIEKCLGKAHHLSQLGVDPATRISIAGEIINICMKSLESEAPND